MSENAHVGDTVRVEFDAEVIEVPPSQDYFDTVTVRESQTGLTVTLPAARMRLVWRAEVGLCCDLHGRNCEPPSEVCCTGCTESGHDMLGFRTGTHANGTACSAPDLSELRL